MQVFHIWPLVTERGGRRYLESLFAEAVSEAQLKQALPFAWMFANGWLAPGSSEAPGPVSRGEAEGRLGAGPSASGSYLWVQCRSGG